MTATVEERVTALEVRMDARDEFYLARHRDLITRLQAQHGLIQALAVTQAEHTATLAGHTTTLAEHTATLGRLEIGVHQVIGMLDVLVQRGDGK